MVMEKKQVKLSRATSDAVAGAVAGGISRTVTSPLDVIKIRFQVQLEPTTSWASLRGNTSGASKYTGMLQATKDIFREEGILGFWRGNVPGLLMVMPYTAIQFLVLQKLKTFAAGSSRTEDHSRLSPYLSFISGGLAGFAAQIGSYPFDLLRTILASQGEPKVYPNMRAGFIDIIRTRGIRGLYAGLSPTLVEIVPYAGLQFGTYDTFKCWTMAWKRLRYSKTSSSSADAYLSSSQLFLCGFASSTLAKLVCHPLDVVKKRFQIAGLARDPKYGARVEHRAYNNLFDASKQILQSEGWAGLYKGIVPSTVKAAPAGAVTFVAYEVILNWRWEQCTNVME
ncbi:hypothetical protein SLE2022_166030 [Rubroshorea leprosula]